jgi:serine/threonine protein phosphatase PrpC/DNA-binding transcriptional MerR regulator
VVAVKLLTIGEFSRAARLSPKALRRYDELGLLRPHAVDKWSGYRYYEPSQLERARLVAWLRRLSMPLAEIGAVLDAPPAAAAALVAEFLKVSETVFAERQQLAQFLIGYLSEGTPATMSDPTAAPLSVRCAAASDQGLVRESNQDASYAGPLALAGPGGPAGPVLLAVADGCGPAGELASAAVIDALRRIRPPAPAAPGAPHPDAADPHKHDPAPEPGDLLTALSDGVAQAVSAVRSLQLDKSPRSAEPAEWDTASTLTAACWTGSALALAHIGDSRAYLLRDGGLFQITHDDTVAQAMVDAGRLTPEEAASHPQRSLLCKAIGATAGGDAATPALSLHDVRAGDRYLLATDGLTAVPVPVIRGVLRDAALSPQHVVARLIALANEAGGPDNVACAVADVIAVP